MARNGENVRGQWTNERHVNFLNSMEASFVQSMLQKKGGNGVPPLDRYLPDTSDSTQDLDKCSKPTRSFLSSSGKLLIHILLYNTICIHVVYDKLTFTYVYEIYIFEKNIVNFQEINLLKWFYI